MKSIFIKAYTALNLGDDLFIKILCERYPNHEFTIMSSKKYSVFLKQIPNLTVKYTVPRVDGLLAKLGLNYRVNSILSRNYIKEAELVVHIGGSIFIEDKIWRKECQTLKKDVEASNEYYVLGSNFGPHSNDKFLSNHRNIFKNATHVSFRDSYSYNLFNELDNVSFSPDIVFSYENERQSYNKEKKIVISVINLENRKGLEEYQQAYENKLVELSLDLISDGYKVIFMGFCKKENDHKTIERIIQNNKLYGNRNISVYNYKGNMDEALDIISESEGIIATRFHSLVLGLLFKIPVYPLIYSNKTLNLLEDINFDGQYSPIKDINELNTSIVIKQLFAEPIVSITDQRTKSINHFSRLDEILNNKGD